MERDLWGFKDVRELEKSTKDMPDMILKEQIALLGKRQILRSTENLSLSK